MPNEFIIGGLSGIVARTVTAPLELCKTQRQNYYMNRTITDVLVKEGYAYMWKGNLTNCIRIFPQSALTFGFNNYLKTLFNSRSKLDTMIYGSVSGIMAMMITYPLETIKTRLSMQMNKSHYTSILDVSKQLSIRTLYQGLPMSMIGFGIFNGIKFMVYDEISLLVRCLDIPMSAQNAIAGGFAGIVALTVSYPTDLLRKHFQMKGFDKNVPEYNSIIDAVSKTVKQRGLSGLYKGLCVSYVKCFPTYAIQFMCYQKGKEYFGV